jgi:phenylacetate-CoA ligase
MIGFTQALRVFQAAGKEVPGYRRFLTKCGIRVGTIKTYADFQQLPVIDKQSYLYRTPYPDQWVRGRVPPMVHVSSGSSGRPTFWFRNDADEAGGGVIHERIFRDIFGVTKKEPTLVVVCFAMGVWVAGTYTLASSREVARKGYALTTITPGIELEDVFHVLRDFAPHFSKVILAGYPPFLMDVVAEARRRKIVLGQDVRILAAAGLFTEEWRDALLAQIGADDPCRSLVNVYGSADVGVMGHETPLSIFVRRAAFADARVYAELFGTSLALPGIYQFDPRFVFFEEVGGELVVTTRTAVPLVRYNIHDVGRVITHTAMARFLRASGLSDKAGSLLSSWRQPFVVVKGRTDVAVTFYALNIYPEHVAHAVGDGRIAKRLTGSFALYTGNIRNSRNERLYVRLELARGVSGGRNFAELCRTVLVERLQERNVEYRKLLLSLGKSALPFVSIRPYGDARFVTLPSRGMVCIKGKKPRVVL